MTPLKLGKLLKHRQALVGRTTLDNVKAMAVTKQVPHPRWSQAPPLPWRRQGSADIYIYKYILRIIYVYVYIYVHMYVYIYIIHTYSTYIVLIYVFTTPV